MRRQLVSAILFASLAAAAACSRAPEMDDAMKRDLEAASAGSIEMAPRGPATSTVSAIESRSPTQPVVAPVKRTVAPAQTPRAETPQQARSSEPAMTPAPAPSKTPDVRPAPPGGYKTMNDVIRNAPFPIKPATKKPA
jgi:hypothetical protein